MVAETVMHSGDGKTDVTKSIVVFSVNWWVSVPHKV